MAQVTVTINGHTYRMACGEGEEAHLSGLAKDLDQRIESLKEGFGEVGDTRLLLMATLTIADELSETKRQIRNLDSEIASLKEARGAIAERLHTAQETIARTITLAAERVEGLSARFAPKAGSE
ncbi:MAG: cell division protein ZapA [Flavobacteriaceae bacterium]